MGCSLLRWRQENSAPGGRSLPSRITLRFEREKPKNSKTPQTRAILPNFTSWDFPRVGSKTKSGSIGLCRKSGWGADWFASEPRLLQRVVYKPPVSSLRKCGTGGLCGSGSIASDECQLSRRRRSKTEHQAQLDGGRKICRAEFQAHRQSRQASRKPHSVANSRCGIQPNPSRP
jgi:hypothetical protein